MKPLLNKIKKLFMILASFFPSRLPQGMTEFGVWADSIIHAYDLQDNDSMRFALATMILHADNEPRTLSHLLTGFPARRSKRYFAIKIRKGIANQVAGGQMQDLKEKQLALAAEEAKKNAQEQSNVQPIK